MQEIASGCSDDEEIRERQQEKKRGKQPVSRAKAEVKRFSRQGLKCRRERVDLPAADYGRLVGVSAQTIYSWEEGKSKPRDEQLASLVAVRGLGKREAQKRLQLLEA